MNHSNMLMGDNIAELASKRPMFPKGTRSFFFVNLMSAKYFKP